MGSSSGSLPPSGCGRWRTARRGTSSTSSGRAAVGRSVGSTWEVSEEGQIRLLRAERLLSKLYRYWQTITHIFDDDSNLQFYLKVCNLPFVRFRQRKKLDWFTTSKCVFSHRLWIHGLRRRSDALRARLPDRPPRPLPLLHSPGPLVESLVHRLDPDSSLQSIFSSRPNASPASPTSPPRRPTTQLRCPLSPCPAAQLR